MSEHVSKPNYAASPIPHLILSPPYEEYCLTPFLPTDGAQLPHIINHPDVHPTIGVDGPMDAAMASAYMDTILLATRDWPYSGPPRLPPRPRAACLTTRCSDPARRLARRADAGLHGRLRDPARAVPHVPAGRGGAAEGRERAARAAGRAVPFHGVHTPGLRAEGHHPGGSRTEREASERRANADGVSRRRGGRR